MTLYDRQVAMLADNRGTVMILVLWTLAMLAMISSFYAVEARIRRNIGHNVLASVQGKYCVFAVLSVVADKVISPSSDNTTEISEEEGHFIDDGTEYLMQFAGHNVRFRIENERCRLDVNKASEEEIKALMSTFLKDDELADTISDSILDWRDSDKLARENGAEDETYQDKRPAYRAANRNFLMLQELLLVNGITPDIFFGPIEWTGAGEYGDMKWTGGLNDLLTVYNPSNKVDINLAPPPLAEAMEEFDNSTPSSGGNNVYRLTVWSGGIVYTIFWSPASGERKFVIYEWQETPESSL
jgi:general secretion pathway protein K